MTVQSTPEASEAPVQEAPEPTVADATTPAEAPPAEQAAPEGAPADSGTSGDETVLERFKLEDVPEEYREHVARYVKQVQGDYTRKTTSLAEQRREVEAEAARVADIRQTFDKLESEETRDEGIRELVSKYGYTFEEAEAEAEAADETADTEGIAEVRDPRVDQLLAERAAQQQQEQAEAQAIAEQEKADTIMDHVDSSLQTYCENEGLVDDEGNLTLRPGQRRQIIAIAAALPRLEGDLPDMETAIAEYEAERSADLQAYLASKRSTVPDVSGSTGTESFDPRDPKQRLAAANRIAEAALARHR
jgi:hypothetical protein